MFPFFRLASFDPQLDIISSEQFDLCSDVLFSEECMAKNFSMIQNVSFFEAIPKFCTTKRFFEGFHVI